MCFFYLEQERKTQTITFHKNKYSVKNKENKKILANFQKITLYDNIEIQRAFYICSLKKKIRNFFFLLFMVPRNFRYSTGLIDVYTCCRRGDWLLCVLFFSVDDALTVNKLYYIGIYVVNLHKFYTYIFKGELYVTNVLHWVVYLIYCNTII